MIVVLLTLGAIRAADLWWWRASTIEIANARASNLAYILAEYIHETFAATDASLRQLALHSQRIGGPDAPDSEWAPTLASARAGLTGVGSISVVDAHGIIRHTTQRAILGQSRADRPVFRRLAAATRDDLLVDDPILTVVQPPQYVLPVSRRLTDKNGAFAGAVVAVIIPAARRAMFRTVDVGTRGVVSVFHPDAIVLFREPSASNPAGESAAQDPVFVAAHKARDGGSGLIESPATSGGAILLTAYRTMAEPNVIVAVSLDRDEVLTEWRHQALGSIVVYAVLTLMLALTALILFRQMSAKTAAERALIDAQNHESQHLKEVNARLEQANRLKDEFLITISHELRTPLTAIRGWARMLQTNTLREEKKDAALQTIERNARTLTKLIDDLLDVSRIVGGKLRLDLRPAEPAEVIRDAIETVLPAADAKRIAIETHIDPTVSPILCDPERLQQVVWNLLSNAIKFTPPDGRVEVRIEQDIDALVIVVSDTGVGITPAFLPHVFERFRQQDAGTQRQHGGLGLGLAIVRHLVELHGGRVTAESEGPNRGATFRVWLPCATADDRVDTDRAAGSEIQLS
jgi:signal transduction histidine kinase